MVCLLCDGDHGLASLQSILAHTDEQTPLLLVGADQATLSRLAGQVSGRDVELVSIQRSLLGSVAQATAAADVAFVSRGTRVGPGWIERLAAAARSDTTIVTATALADHAGALSVPLHRPEEATSIAQQALRSYPRIMRAGSHCVFVRRCAFDLVGEPKTQASDPEVELREFSLTCLEHGMVHVAADDVFVTCDPPVEDLPVAEFERDDYEDERSTLRRALRISTLAVHERLSVTLDARALGPPVGGTQVYIAQLAVALARSDDATVRLVIAPDDVAPELKPRLTNERGLEVITYETAVSGVEPTHVVHRPQQVFSEHDLALLRLLGERIVITHQDLIAYRNPTYHASVDDWRQYRRVTRIALAVADKVVFFSEHARNDVVTEGLLDADHAEVVGIGADTLWRVPTKSRRPDRAPGDGAFVLCLGADYRHKNRAFAIQVVGRLRGEHGWSGKLVLAGAHVAHGSSQQEEQALITADPTLSSAVIDLGPVDEAGKIWLYEHATAVLFPSLYEGFGLIPYEAARANIPCMFAQQTALAEIGGPELATLIAWDARASASATAPLLIDGRAREQHLERLGRAAAESSWDVVTPRVISAYEAAVRADHRAGAHYAWQERERERNARELAHTLEMHRAALGGDAANLVRPDGWLDETTRRGLMRVASRPAARKLVMWPFSLVGRIPAERDP